MNNLMNNKAQWSKGPKGFVLQHCLPPKKTPMKQLFSLPLDTCQGKNDIIPLGRFWDLQIVGPISIWGRSWGSTFGETRSSVSRNNATGSPTFSHLPGSITRLICHLPAWDGAMGGDPSHHGMRKQVWCVTQVWKAELRSSCDLFSFICWMQRHSGEHPALGPMPEPQGAWKEPGSLND